MKNRDKSLYEFGKFRLDLAERLLLRSNKPVALTAKVFDLLTVLVENSGHLLEKDELMERIWPNIAVEEGNLARYISTLRKVLGENGEHQYIETVPRRGYRFVADVKVVEAEEENLELRVQARARVGEQVEETDDRNEVKSEIEGRMGPEPKPQEGSRGRRQALIAGLAAAIIAGTVYWWTNIKTRPTERYSNSPVARAT